MKTLYLVKAAETIFNKTHKLQGWCDSPLTQKGIDQAKTVGNYFKEKGIIFDHAYCSTSERACNTLELITDMPYTRYKELKSRGLGKYEGKSEKYNPIPRVDYSGDYYDVESLSDFSRRSEDIIRRTIMPRENHEKVLIVTHKDVIINFFNEYKHRTDLELINEQFTPGSFIKFEVDDYIYYARDIYYNNLDK